jgi:hypothetical protein
MCRGRVTGSQTRHPHPVLLDGGIQLAAVLVLEDFDRQPWHRKMYGSRVSSASVVTWDAAFSGTLATQSQ